MKTVTYLALAVSLAAIAGNALAGDFKLESNDIRNGATLPMAQVYHGCGGENISPELHWSGAPAGVKSFALTMYDPDAPTGSGWWHWQIYDIPASASSLPRGAGDVDSNAAPKGSVQTRNDFGETGYGGACPPKGSKPHRYQFTLYALDTDRLRLQKSASAAMVGYNLKAHALAQSRIEALYAR